MTYPKNKKKASYRTSKLVLAGLMVAVGGMGLLSIASASGPCLNGSPGGVSYNVCLLQFTTRSESYSYNNGCGPRSYSQSSTQNTPVSGSTNTPAGYESVVATQGAGAYGQAFDAYCYSYAFGGHYKYADSAQYKYTQIGAYGVVNAGVYQYKGNSSNDADYNYCSYSDCRYGAYHQKSSENATGAGVGTFAASGTPLGYVGAGAQQYDQQNDATGSGCNYGPGYGGCYVLNNHDKASGTVVVARAAGVNVKAGQWQSSYDDYVQSGSYYYRNVASQKNTGVQVDSAATGRVFVGQESINGSPCATMVAGENVASCVVEAPDLAKTAPAPTVPDFPAPPL